MCARDRVRIFKALHSCVQYENSIRRADDKGFKLFFDNVGADSTVNNPGSHCFVYGSGDVVPRPMRLDIVVQLMNEVKRTRSLLGAVCINTLQARRLVAGKCIFEHVSDVVSELFAKAPHENYSHLGVYQKWRRVSVEEVVIVTIDIDTSSESGEGCEH